MNSRTFERRPFRSNFRRQFKNPPYPYLPKIIYNFIIDNQETKVLGLFREKELADLAKATMLTIESTVREVYIPGEGLIYILSKVDGNPITSTEEIQYLLDNSMPIF